MLLFDTEKVGSDRNFVSAWGGGQTFWI